MNRNELTGRVLAAALAGILLISQNVSTTFAEEIWYPQEEYTGEYYIPEGPGNTDFYYDDGFVPEHEYEEVFYGDEYSDNEYFEEEEYSDEEEETEEPYRGKSDPEYGADEYHQRRKPEDTYRFRNNPKESAFEDFDILTTEDAKQYFHLANYNELPTEVELNVPELLQLPELPTGCESVTLTMALRYEGFDLLKTEIAAEFLIYNLKDENAAIGFIGDPFDDSGAGCFAPALVATADNYFIDQDYNYRAFDISGTEMDELLGYVAAGTPVMVWSTMFMDEVDFTGETGEYNGQEYKWYKAEHCVLITGYNLEKGTIRINDPLEGIVERDYEAFRDIYNQVGQYAVVVKNLDTRTYGAATDVNASLTLGIMIETEAPQTEAAKKKKKNKN